MLDLLDKKIIEKLDTDARASASEIAKSCKVPKETVNYRIRRLVKKGYIRYFYTIINSARLGYRYHRIFLQFHKITSDKEKELIGFLLEEGSCANLRVLEGPYDMVFITTHNSLDTLKQFITAFLERFGGVIRQKSIHTIYSSSKYSSDGDPIWFSHGGSGSVSIDSVDMSILKILAYDARISLIDLAKKVGKDHSVVRYRIKNLKEKGIIVSSAPLLDYSRFGQEHIQIDIALKDITLTSSVLSFFEETGKMIYGYELIGKYDISVEIRVTDDTELRTILNRFRESFAQNYITYDVSHIYQEFITNWSPYNKNPD